MPRERNGLLLETSAHKRERQRRGERRSKRSSITSGGVYLSRNRRKMRIDSKGNKRWAKMTTKVGVRITDVAFGVSGVSSISGVWGSDTSTS